MAVTVAVAVTVTVAVTVVAVVGRGPELPELTMNDRAVGGVDSSL